jgi:hypothetical protein
LATANFAIRRIDASSDESNFYGMKFDVDRADLADKTTFLDRNDPKLLLI